MSRWRREASERLPELQSVIASRDVDSPMMLWIQLRFEFDRLCEEDEGAFDLLQRIWGYASWCLEHGESNVSTAAALGFCEHLLDSEAQARMLPRLMTRADFLGLKELFLYHNSEECVAHWLHELWDSKRR